MEGIKLVFIANGVKNEIIGSYPDSEKGAEYSNAKSIYEKYIKSDIDKIPNQRSVINGKEGTYYFTINEENIYYLVLVNSTITESTAFGLMDQLQKDCIPSNVDMKTNKLTKSGKSKLKESIQNYLNSINNSSMNKLKAEINEAQGQVQQNIKDILTNVDKLDELDEKAVDIAKGADKFKRKSNELKNQTRWEKIKWFVIIGIIVAIILIIIIASAVSNKNKKNKELDNSSNNQGNNSTRLLSNFLD